MQPLRDSKELIDEMNRYYEARAPWHDQYMSYTSSQAMEKALGPVVEMLAPVVRNKQVLEVACGTGNWTQILAGRAAQVVALDQSQSSLKLAARKLTEHPNVTLSLADAYSLAQISGKFNVLFAADWWSHVPNQHVDSFMAGVNKILSPSSKVIFVDMLIGDFFRQEECYIDDHDNRISVRTLPDGSRFRVVKNFPGERELREAFGKYASNIAYHSFPNLRRWMVILELH